MDDDEKLAKYGTIMMSGPIIELLEPAARSYVNIPQLKSAENRINCAENDGTYKIRTVV
jgi:hypothetical protein